MHSQKLMSFLVFWVALLLCLTRVVSSDDLSELQKSELANKLDMLVRHSGWRLMHSVKTIVNRNQRREIADPMSEILEALTSDRKPVNESNVLERYNDIWTVLRCKYADVMVKYRLFILNLIRVCEKEKIMIYDKTSYASLRRYYDCFNLVLIKLEAMSPRFRCMKDALDVIYSLGPQSRPKENVMLAAEKLTEFTMTLRPRTLFNLPTHGIDEELIDREINTISEFFSGVSKDNIQWFAYRYCSLPSHRFWTLPILTQDFQLKKLNQLIPMETTMVQFVENIIDGYVDDIFVDWFYNLGFAYDETGNVSIRTN